MRTYETGLQKEMFIVSLRAQMHLLKTILIHIENNNPINGYVDENLKSIEKELRWARNSYFNN